MAFDPFIDLLHGGVVGGIEDHLGDGEALRSDPYGLLAHPFDKLLLV